ncbi:efflux RND transporter periplasmic adaptor subunit [Pseudomonas sp. nanlin1]|uniref:efflux RND transporter periplasmic adaptor subunit n=1 Tax=Pseudomonas sp. nanlin1 TaxID=3040605 RepID=UPI00388E755E
MTKLNGTIGLGLVLCAALAWSLWPVAPAPAEALWHEVRAQPVTVRLGLVGLLQPARQVMLSAPFDALVKQRLAEPGQQVERGQVLLELDTHLHDPAWRDAQALLLTSRRAVADLENWATSAEVARARRSLAAARLGLAQTQRQLAETQGLLAQGIVPRMEVEALEQQTSLQRLDVASAEGELRGLLDRDDDLNVARLQLANAQARFDAVAQQRGTTQIVAPFSGILSRAPEQGSALLSLDEGSRLTQGQGLFQLASLEQLAVDAEVDESDLHALQLEQPVEVQGDGFSGLTLPGHIAHLSQEPVTQGGSATSVRYRVRALLQPVPDTQRARLRLGMSTRMSVVIYQRESAWVVPVQTVRRGPEGYQVQYRPGPGGSVTLRAVTLGRALPEGLEVFGLQAGQVRELTSEELAPEWGGLGTEPDT